MIADLRLRSINPWTALVVSIMCGSIAQVVLKHASNLRAVKLKRSSFYHYGWFVLWAFLFATATMSWIIALKHLDISYAYPLLSITYVLVTAMATLFLNEYVSVRQWAAVGLISLGAVLVARSI